MADEVGKSTVLSGLQDQSSLTFHLFTSLVERPTFRKDGFAMASLRGLAERFAKLADLRAMALEKLQSLKGANDAQFDLSKVVSGVEHSFVEIDARVMAICQLAESLDGERDVILLPQGLVNPIIKPLDQLIAQYQSIIDSTNNIESQGGPGSLDAESNSVQSKNGQVNLQIGGTFQNIWNQSETVLGLIYPVLNIARGDAEVNLSAPMRAFSKAVEQVSDERKKLAALAKEASVDKKRITDYQKQSEPLRNEIERLKTESEKDRRTLAEYAGEGTQSIASIRATTEQTEQLRSAVEVYRVSFDSFQKQLSERELTIEEGNSKQQELVDRLHSLEEQISALNERAEAMLSGATVAGLAGSFGALRDKLSGELQKARLAFYFSIFLLFVSVLPLAMYVFPGLAEFVTGRPATVGTSGDSATELVAHIAARALLLLPAAWFARFAAARHAALFKLKEHYAYKYSVASSVEGFKKQADPFKEAIAAATFFELTFNPANRMDARGAEERHPNPVMEWVMKKLGATYDGKAS